MAPNDNFIQRAVNDTVAGAGSYAGGIVDSAGKTVSGAGRNVGNSVTSSTNSVGSATSNYANGIKDATKASGPRTQTAQNPLGTSGNTYSGKNTVKGSGGKVVDGGSGTAGNPLGLS